MGIFIDEFNSFFLEKLKDLTVMDADGNEITIPVSYHMPEGEGEEDFHDTKATFFFYDMLLDTQRLQSIEQLVVAEDTENNEVSVMDIPVPYKLYYQFDIWSEWNEDIMMLIPQFQALFPPRGDINILTVNPDTLEPEENHFFMELLEFKQADSRLWASAAKQTDKRFFRSVYRYCIYADLIPSMVKTYKRVAEDGVILDVEQKADASQD